MRFLNSLLATPLALGFLTSATPLQTRQDTLLPFEVTAVTTSNPPGRPGSTPWRYIQANVTDPNSYSITEGSYNKTVPAGLQGINCEARWYRGESPEGRTWPCNSVEQGHFALQVLPGTGASAGVSDFKLVFIHQLEAPPLSVFKRYQATSSFKAGDNLNTGCSASGWCSYRLEPALKPVLVAVTETKAVTG